MIPLVLEKRGIKEGKRYAIIEREFLHPEIQAKIAEIRGARSQRFKSAAETGAKSVLAVGSLAVGAGLELLFFNPKSGFQMDPAVLPLIVAGAGLGGARSFGKAALRARKASSEANQEYFGLHRELGERIREGGIFDPNLKVGNAVKREKQLRNKFKYWVINGKGQLELMNRGYFLGLLGRKRGTI